MTTPLKLQDIWQPEHLRQYKVHFARWNGHHEPLHVMARSMDEWKGWQSWYPSKNDFNRKYIFSLARIPFDNDHWIFGGVWEVHGLREREDGSKYYDVTLTEQLKPLTGRLKLHRVYKQRGTRVRIEPHFEHFTVAEILPEKYTGKNFPGYESIDVSFQELETLMRNNRQDWAAPLKHIKGVYMITDAHTHQQYVGSAYGDWGIWSRWRTYIDTGHGGNVGLRDLLKNHDLDYCREYFRFTLLEHRDVREVDTTIIARENFWKKALNTRSNGLNMN